MKNRKSITAYTPKQLSVYQLVYASVCIMAVVGFFLPWMSAGFLGSFSGFKLVSIGLKFGMWQAGLLLLIPLLFAFLAIQRIIHLRAISGKLIKAFEVTVLLITSLPAVYLILRVLRRPDVQLEWHHLVDFFGYGFAISLIGCLFVLFSPMLKHRPDRSLLSETVRESSEDKNA